MNEALRKREPGASSVKTIHALAKSLNERLEINPEYMKPIPRQKSGAKAHPAPSRKPDFPEVTTDLGADSFPRASARTHAPARTQPQVVIPNRHSSPDDGSIHDSSDEDPVDAVAAFLNARPVPTNAVATAAAGQDWDSLEADDEKPDPISSQNSLLTMILDALRQGVEVYSRVVSRGGEFRGMY